MSYLKKYGSFVVNENKNEDISLQIIRTLSWLRGVISNSEGLYMPFVFKNRKVMYETSRLISELINTSIFDVLKIHISRSEKEGDSYDTRFSNLVKSRTGTNVLYNLDFITKSLIPKNIKFSVREESEKSSLEKFVKFVKLYKSIIERVDNNQLDNKVLLALRQLTELIRDINSQVESGKINESYDSNDSNFIMGKIKQKFTKDLVSKMLEDEIKMWVSDDWVNDFKSESDWYTIHGGGEAEEIIIDQMIDWFEKEFNREVNEEQRTSLKDEIENEYF